MFILYLSLILIFLQSLALDYELLVSYTYLKLVVVPFIIVRINLFFTKLFLFPSIQKPDRHLVMAKYSDAMNPDKFTGVNFKRWQMRA
jgi:hypothetical protein